MEQNRLMLAYLLIATMIVGIVIVGGVARARARERRRFTESGYAAKRPWWSGR